MSRMIEVAKITPMFTFTVTKKENIHTKMVSHGIHHGFHTHQGKNGVVPPNYWKGDYLFYFVAEKHRPKMTRVQKATKNNRKAKNTRYTITDHVPGHWKVRVYRFHRDVLAEGKQNLRNFSVKIDFMG